MYSWYHVYVKWVSWKNIFGNYQYEFCSATKVENKKYTVLIMLIDTHFKMINLL